MRDAWITVRNAIPVVLVRPVWMIHSGVLMLIMIRHWLRYNKVIRFTLEVKI